MATTAMQKQEILMHRLGTLLSHDLGYIFGERESGPNGEKKEFLDKGKQDARHFWHPTKNDIAPLRRRGASHGEGSETPSPCAPPYQGFALISFLPLGEQESSTVRGTVEKGRTESSPVRHTVSEANLVTSAEVTCALEGGYGHAA